MFTVCPKCALTLVVTAADLRVAQGYVRCGRCSNVFNALARLSEDRTGTTQSPAPASKPSQPRSEVSGTFRTKAPADSPSKGATRESPAASAATPPPVQTPPAPEPKRYDYSVGDEDLEFKPDATDINKVFVQPPPSPKFEAATGTFKTLKLEAENASRAAQELARTGERQQPPPVQLEPVDTQVDVEIDPDLLATMAQLTSNRLEKLSPPPPPDSPEAGVPAGKSRAPEKPAREASEKPAHEATAKPARETTGKTAPPATEKPLRSTPAATTKKAAAATPGGPGIDKGPAKPTRDSQPPEPARVAEKPPDRPIAPPDSPRPRDVARASDLIRTPDPNPAAAATAAEMPDLAQGLQAKRATAFETTQALREALAPRKRPEAAETTDAASQPPTSRLDGIWAGGSVALLLLLFLQIVHHYRNDLAATSTFNGPLTSIYAAVGIPVVPRWDLNAYEVRQLGASTGPDTPGQITVRASVKNTGHQAQPLPLLRVTLQDRFGNRIASRDVTPQSYLPRAIPRSSVLAAGQRVDAEMAFVDPGANAVGFEIDACLPAPGGDISCSNDAPR